LEEFLAKRDYTGAISLLDFNRNSGKGSEELDMWLGYAAFHAADYKRAMLEFEALTHAKKVRIWET
jgi:intraflagellar transport protein 56